MIVEYCIISLIIIVVFLLLPRMSYRNIKIFNIICCIILCIIAYKLFPQKSLDIYRYYNQIEIAQQVGIEYIFNHEDYKTLPIAGLYISLFVILKNQCLLPMITCFIYYFFISNIIIKYSQKNEKNKYGLIVSLIAFYCISNYLGVISGIRNPMTISLFCYILYKDLIMGYSFKKSIIWYIALCLLHPSVVILLIIRLLLKVNNDRYDKIICLLLLFWTLLKNEIISILLKITSNQYVLLLSQKLLAYDTKEANAVANVSLYTLVYLLFYVGSILIYYIYIMKNEKENRNTFFDRYYKYLLCFCMGSVFEYHMFVRFSRSVLMLLAIPIINIISTKRIKGANKVFIIFWILTESLIFLLFYLTGQYTLIRIS